jgi:23S rRNA (cytosine1962-C5)-methyltransferase
LDVFKFLEDASKSAQKWDLIIVDPPSFVHQSSQIDAAISTYKNLFIAALKVAAPKALIAFSSCSSKIESKAFDEIISEAISKARRRARVITSRGQPADHPFPLACEDLRYLKFVVVELN